MRRGLSAILSASQPQNTPGACGPLLPERTGHRVGAVQRSRRWDWTCTAGQGMVGPLEALKSRAARGKLQAILYSLPTRRRAVKLATFTHAGRTRIGLVNDSEVVDLATAVPDLPQEMCAFLRAGQPALDAARQALTNRSARLRLSDVWLEA